MSLAAPIPQGLSEMMLSKDGGQAQRRLTRLVQDNIFYFQPSDTTKPIGLIALSGIKKIEVDAHNLSLVLTMQSRATFQLTALTRASFVVWRDDLKQKVGKKAEIVEGDASPSHAKASPVATPVAAQPVQAAPAPQQEPIHQQAIQPVQQQRQNVPQVQRAEASPAQRAPGIPNESSAPPSAMDFSTLPSRGPSEAGPTTGYNALPHQYTTTQSYAGSEEFKPGEQHQYQNTLAAVQQQQPQPRAGPGSPGTNVQQMVDAYQAMLKKYDDSSQERQTLMLNFEKLQEAHERLQQENQNLKLEMQKLELSNAEIQRQLESMVNTTDEALSQAERLRKREMQLQSQLRAQFEEVERARIEAQEKSLEPLLDELKGKIEKKYTELLEKQAETNEKAMQDLMFKSDNMVNDVLKQRDQVIENQRAKIRELEDNGNHVQMVQSRFEEALQAQEQQWSDNMNQLRNEYELKLDEAAKQQLVWEQQMKEMETRLRIVYEDKINQTCQVADEQVASVRRDASAQARQWGEAKEHLMKQIAFYQQELKNRDMQPPPVMDDPNNYAPAPPAPTVHTHSAMEGNLRTLLEAKKQECEDLKKKLMMSRAWINH